MAFTVTIDGTNSGQIGQAANYTATASGAAVEGVLSYVWTVDGAPQSESTNVFRYTAASPAGVKVIKVVVTSTPTEGDPETAEATKNVTVRKKANGTTLSVAPSPSSVEVNKPITFTATAAGQPSGAAIAIKWFVDEALQSGQGAATFIYTPTATGSQVVKCEITVTATDYEDKTVSATSALTVSAPVIPEPEGEIPFYHPLPQRGSVYIWCGWWVMDEIQKMTEEGKNWKIEDPDSKYYLHRYTLNKLITDFPEVDVQESRNGYIVHKTALEAGIIY